ncbi:hypothetical protein Tco_1315952 [Tanacetum coccineum]
MCTKTNLENKSVNDTLTAELERYKEQVKVLKEGQNVDLKSQDNVSDSCAQSVEIDHLKRTLLEHLKEKESLLQTVTLLKNDFKKEESRNLDREIALEKQIKHLDNIVFKRDQSAQTVHMLTKPQFFYDNTTKQALGFQNPFYLKKAQQLEPMLYVGDIIQKTNPIVIPNSEETLTLAEESHPPLLRLPKELPKVSMVNTSLKKLKYHLANFDVAVEQHHVESKTFEVKMNQALNENERLLEQVMSKDIVNLIINSSMDFAICECAMNEKSVLKLETDLQTDFTYKQLYDSIKPARIRSKEQCEDLIDQVNLKSVEISDLNASLQEKVLVITTLKDDLRKLKGKALVGNDVTKHPSDPEMLKINMEPITPKLLNKRTTHSGYIDHIKANYPLDHSLESACRYTKLIQELLTNISKTCPSINNSGEKLVVVTPKNKEKRVRFTEPVTSLGKTITKIASSSNLHSKLNVNFKLKCVKCNGCMLFDNHDLCVLDFINNVNAHEKSKSIKKSSKRKVWKPTGKVFTNIGYIWGPTGRTFTIVGNVCPLTRITTTTEESLRQPTVLENETPKPVVTLVYSRKPRKSKTNVPASKSKVIKYVSANKKETSQSWGSIVSDVPSSSLDERRSSKLFSCIWTPAAPSIRPEIALSSPIFVNKFLGIVKFGNDHMAKIVRYGDY